MALAAALTRAATLLLRGGGGVPPAASAAAVPGISLRIHRQLCGLSTVDEPAAAGEADPWEEAEAEILRDVKPVVELVKDILHSRRSASVPVPLRLPRCRFEPTIWASSLEGLQRRYMRFCPCVC